MAGSTEDEGGCNSIILFPSMSCHKLLVNMFHKKHMYWLVPFSIPFRQASCIPPVSIKLPICKLRELCESIKYSIKNYLKESNIEYR